MAMKTLLSFAFAACSPPQHPVPLEGQEVELRAYAINSQAEYLFLRSVPRARDILGVPVEYSLEDASEVPTEWTERHPDLHSEGVHIDVFVVLDVAKRPLEPIAGYVEWKSSWCDLAVIISLNEASDTTLAHELGHVFGLPDVSDPGNLMYHRAGEVNWPVLTDGQISIVRARVADREMGCLEG